MNNLIDVFIRCPVILGRRGELRQGLATSCFRAWESDFMAEVFLVPHLEANVSLSDYHWHSRRYAERNSNSDFYVLSDDDILPLGMDWINRALAVAMRNPDYTILSANQVNYSARVKHQGYEVQPAKMIGSPQLIKKGVIDWTQLSGPGKDEDEIVSKYCDDHELKCGVMVEMDVNHIGQGFSVMNPSYWGKY